MTKITPDHLARSAFVYIRQSTPDQVLNNHESRRRQYGLASSAFWRQTRGAPERSSRSRPPAWRATAATGIR